MSNPDFLTSLDSPLVNSLVFFPRPDMGFPPPAGSEDLNIEVEPGVKVMARYHPAALHLPTLLYFHGNGEIVADYDPLATTFKGCGASFVCVDYRGYGRSGGQPSIRTLIEDVYPVLDAVLAHLRQRGHSGPLAVMGRSLGSAPAIELAANRPQDIAGLILESGFARTLDLLQHLGIPTQFASTVQPQGDDNADKMTRVNSPVLLLHAEYDNIIPFWHAEQNHEQAASQQKRLVKILNADHNTIMMFGGQTYWGAITDFLKQLSV
ncbi:MAG: alpha/beta fold hydrolase [Candidatus Competibacteraceae bacterium]|jgi:alpha-beta hydrolase superfamily lysophospholipase|nr:alpha/beta fold hydrolase [Candidatus Competibacteraceae bacterium]